jgi:hypothetical protein
MYTYLFVKQPQRYNGQRVRRSLVCIRLAVASDKVYQLFANGRWFSLGTPTSPTTKIGRHDIAELQYSQFSI